MNFQDRMFERLRAHKYAILFLPKSLWIGTPFCFIEITSPFGAPEPTKPVSWTGIKISWKANKERKEGEVYWLKERAFILSSITYLELAKRRANKKR